MRGSNATYIYPLTLGLALGGCDSRWVDLNSCWVREAFCIPTCWYFQREMVALGFNAPAQREWFCVAVEYRLNSIASCHRSVVELPTTNNFSEKKKFTSEELA